MSTFPVAVIGTGFMGRTHFDAYRSLPDVEVCGIVSRTERVFDETIPVFPTVEALLRDTAPRLVSVCTPTRTHASLVEQLLSAGVDVVCEKPLALDEHTGLEMLRRADSLGRRLHVAHVLRFIEPYERMTELVRSGRLGKIGTVRLRRAVPPPAGADGWFLNQSESGGVELDLMVHDIDFLIGCFGPPEEVYAQKRVVGQTQTAIATFRFAGGAIAIAEASWGGVTELDYSCEVAGSEGNASFTSTPSAPLLIIRSTNPEAATVSAPLPVTASGEPYRRQLQSFVAESRAEASNTDARRQTLGTLRTCSMVSAAITSGRNVSASMTDGALA